MRIAPITYYWQIAPGCRQLAVLRLYSAFRIIPVIDKTYHPSDISLFHHINQHKEDTLLLRKKKSFGYSKLYMFLFGQNELYPQAALNLGFQIAHGSAPKVRCRIINY